MATKTTKSTAKKTTRRRSKKSGDRGVTIKGKNNR